MLLFGLFKLKNLKASFWIVLWVKKMNASQINLSLLHPSFNSIDLIRINNLIRKRRISCHTYDVKKMIERKRRTGQSFFLFDSLFWFFFQNTFFFCLKLLKGKEREREKRLSKVTLHTKNIVCISSQAIFFSLGVVRKWRHAVFG